MSKVEREVVTVYKVHRGWGRDEPLKLVALEATRTAKQVKLSKSHQAFGFVQQGPPEDYCFTPVDAFNKFRHRAGVAYGNAKAKVAEAEADITEVESLFCKFVADGEAATVVNDE